MSNLGDRLREGLRPKGTATPTFIPKDLEKLEFIPIGEWNNRFFYKKGSLYLIEHCGTFYWDTNNQKSICYDYPINSISQLKELVKLYDKFDFCKNNPYKVTLAEYNKCLSKIRSMRKVWFR